MKSKLFFALLACLFASAALQAQDAPTCTQLVERVLEIQNSRQASISELSQDSILGKHRELVDSFENLNTYSIRVLDEYQHFVASYGRVPTVKELLEVSFKQKELLLENYDTLLQQLRSLNDPSLETFMAEVRSSRERLSEFKSLEVLGEELADAHSNGNVPFNSLETPVLLSNSSDRGRDMIDVDIFRYLNDRTSLGHFHGEYGELLAMASSSHEIVQRSLLFRFSDDATLTSYQTQIKARVDDLTATVERMSEAEVLELVDRYSDGLFRTVKNYIDEQNNVDMEEVVNRLLNMVGSKEIDLVSKTNRGRVIWSEVKSYSKPVTLETLEGGSGKSVVDQLLEHRQLRDILGLENEVTMEFVSPLSPVDAQAREALQALGFEVRTIQ